MTHEEINKQSIRKRAEAVIDSKNIEISQQLQTLTLNEVKKIVHELEVHQIELEMQNEELYKMQEELERTKKRYFDLYEMAPVSYCTFNQEGIIQEVNLATSSLLGIDGDELIHQPLSNFIFQEDQDAYYMYRKKLMSSGEREECELRMTKADNTHFLAHLRAIGETNTDETSVLRLVIHDISERKLFEEKLEQKAVDLQKAQSLAKIGSWRYEIDKDILTWSDEAYKIFEINKIKYPITTLNDFFKRINPDYIKIVNQEYAKHLKDGIPYDVIHEIILEDGTLKWVHEKCETIYDNSGKPIESQGIVQDITVVKTQEISLKEKEHILIEQSKLAQMGEMLNMIAHQWRQPLNAMSASAINLSLKNQLDMLDEESIEKTSAFIQQQVQNMSKIIDDFMEFNKPDTNKEFLLFEPVNEVAKMISTQLTNRTITLEVNIDKEIKVYHNSKNIEHVLLNLITNSRDAFEEKRDIEDKKIKIFTTADENSVTLTVEDNAGGIPKDIIDKVFNPYFTTKAQGKGTGIGLYMSKKMVENIDGTTINIEVMNDSTLFRIKFERDYNVEATS